jgi:hypothetical protein
MKANASEFLFRNDRDAFGFRERKYTLDEGR